MCSFSSRLEAQETSQAEGDLSRGLEGISKEKELDSL